ncbi:MAG TPA: dehydrogenase [Microscillaceae bacterium]|nr:dehydrogenase [Microscillaceae bacterium]
MIEQNDEFRHSFSFTQEDVAKFAEVTGDNNPIHLDADYAAKTPFSQPIMHGFLAGSIFSKVFGTMFPGEGTIYMKQTMEFRRPMFVDKTYEAVFTVAEVNKEKHRAVVTTKIVNKEDGKETLKGEALVMNTEKI